MAYRAGVLNSEQYYGHSKRLVYWPLNIIQFFNKNMREREFSIGLFGS